MRCAALCQKKQSFPAQYLHCRCDLIYSYGVLLTVDAITVLSNTSGNSSSKVSLICTTMKLFSSSNAKKFSNFNIDNTLTHSPTPTSHPGIVDICWWGPPVWCSPTTACPPAVRSCPPPVSDTSTSPSDETRGSRVQQGQGTVLVCTISHS